MNSELIKKIDALIDDARSEVAKTTIELVNIKSVEEAPLPGAPFGAGPRKVLDRVMEMGADAGFYNVDYNVGVISIAMKDSEPDLGIWIHGDVVPEGVGWTYDPYDAVEYKGCIIGRGATDNKGQFAAVYHLFKIFKELNIELKYNPAIYVGSNEESGMKDLLGMPGNPDARGFLNVCTPPKVSFVPDTGFPAGYMGKGALRLLVRSKTPLKNFTFIAGQDDAPGRAAAVFPAQNGFPETLPECHITKQEDGSFVVTADSPPVHGTRPDPNGNMITKLSSALLEYCDMSDSERRVMEFFKRTSKDVYGTLMGLEVTNEEMGKLTIFSKRADFDDNYPALFLDIRYPIDITWPEIIEKVAAGATEFDFEIAGVYRGANPYKMEPNPEIVDALCQASKEVLCEDKKLFCVTGNAYGHYLPNAYAFGMDGNLPPADFPKGRGGAHGIDEAVSLDRLHTAMKIYARALLALNDVELCGSEPLEIRACQRDKLCPPEVFVPTAQGLVDYAKNCMKVPHIYLWDGNGQYVTTDIVNELAAKEPDWYTPEKKAVRLTLADKGIRGWDCIGIIKGYAWNDYHQYNTAWYSKDNDFCTRELIKAAKVQGPIEDMPEKPGLILWKTGHVGVYIGDGQVIDMTCGYHSTDITHLVGGLQQRPIEAGGWTHWLEYPGIDYSERT